MKVRVWGVGTGELIHTLEGHSDAVTSATFSPEGFRIASASRDQTVKVWDATKSEAIHSLEGHFDCVAAFTPDGSRIVSANYFNTVIAWNDVSGEILESSDKDTDVHCHKVLSQGNRFTVD